MFPGIKVRKGKTTHPAQFLVLSSVVPNLGVSLVPSTQYEITDQTFHSLGELYGQHKPCSHTSSLSPWAVELGVWLRIQWAAPHQ